MLQENNSQNASRNASSSTVDYGPRAKASRFKGVIAAALLSGVVALGAVGQAVAEDVDLPFGADAPNVYTATCYAWLPLEERVAQSDLVVVGEVVGSSEPYLYSEMIWASPTYHRDVYLRVSHVVKGTPTAVSGFADGFTLGSALNANVEGALQKGAATVVIRTVVDSYGGIAVSTGMGEIDPGTEALFFLYTPSNFPDIHHYMLLSGEGGMFRQLPEGGYEFMDIEGPRIFTIEELEVIAAG